MNDDTTNESNSDGFLDRIKESPRTVSALIIILIVAAAIYAFSGEPKKPSQELAQNGPTVTDGAAVDGTETGENVKNAEETEEATVPATAGTTAPAAAPVMTSQPLSAQQLQEMSQNLPAAERQDKAFVETAQAGDGITHLARRATTRWLAENNAGYAITNEHRIFIEDYIKDHVGTDRLSVGETRTVSFDLIAEAVKAAGELNQKQLHNLSHYTPALT